MQEGVNKIAKKIVVACCAGAETTHDAAQDQAATLTTHQSLRKTLLPSSRSRQPRGTAIVVKASCVRHQARAFFPPLC